MSALTAALRSSVTTSAGDAEARREAQLALADERASLLSELMAREPAQAIAQSLSFADYAALPEEVQQRVERPFSIKGDFNVLCPDGRQHPAGDGAEPGSVLYSTRSEGATGAWHSYVEHRRGGLASKVGIPLQGIELRGQAALRDDVMQVLDVRDAEAAQTAFGMTVANQDPARDFLTGEPIVAKPVTAAAGGRLFLFANAANADNLNAELAQMERQPGPHSGSQVLFMAFPFAPGEAGGGFNVQGAWKAVRLQANGWTETKKKIYVIRVDFPDFAGESASKANLEALYNYGVSNQVFNMSYGKTWAEATASPMVVRLPNGTNTYREDVYVLLDHAKTAFDALGTGVNLADYDIVCVAFRNFGLRYFGILFSGLGGGTDMWLQGNVQLYVVVHELGHCYGLGHAHAWATTDGSVVGPGASQEYGDPFDNMGGGPLPEGYWHMQSKSYLNWLTTSQWTDVTASGTYRVYRIDDRNTGPAFSRALRIRKASAPAEYYWAGYRRAFTANRHLSSGANLLWQQPNHDTSHSLDTTPGSAAGKEDSAVLVGRTYSDTVANVHITPIASGGAGADEWLDITVNLGPFPGNQPPAVGALSGPTSWTARTPTTYSVTATDPDGDTLSYSWDLGDGVRATNANFLSQTWLVGGDYTVRVTVSDMKGQVVTRTLSVNVSDPLSEWTLRTASPMADLKDICTGRNGSGTPIALAVGGAYAFSSVNGADWTTAPFNEGSILRAVTYNGQRFIAAGYHEQDSQTAAIWTSEDGVTWTRRYTGSAGTVIDDVAAGGQTAVAVAKAGRILYSTDGGTSWNVATTSATRDFQGVSWGDGTFMAVGANGDNTSTHVFTSTDGMQWTDRSAGTGLLSWHTLEVVDYARDRFLSSGWYSLIRHSTDPGTSFQTTRTSVEHITAFAYGNGLFFAAGLDLSHGDADINLVSTDGAYWSPLPTVTQNDRQGAVFFKDTFITVADGGVIWQSPVFTTPGGAVAPSAITLAATDVGETVATINGSANPNGAATIGFFQWGTTTDYGQTTATVNLGSGASEVPLSTQLVGLAAGQTYHFRAAASNSAGISFGSDQTFTMSGGLVPPIAVTSPATGVAESEPRLHGSVNPNGSPTVAYFQWGIDDFYGQTTPVVNVGSGTELVPLSAPLFGLNPGQTYHYQTVASNSLGVAYGQDLSFTMPAVQVSGPLVLDRAGNNLILRWPEGVRGVLQESPSLNPPDWRNSPSGSANPVTLPPTNRLMFYRLAILPSYRWASRVLGHSSAYGANPPDDWGVAQVLGVTNTYPAYGDIGTAWAPANPDDPTEFLELGFDAPDQVSSVSIYETYAPGAVSKVSVRNPTNGLWVEVWSGPASPAPAVARIFTVRFPRTSFPVDAVRIDLDSVLVPDYNEIDAVSITSNDDFVHRAPLSGEAAAASASNAGASRELGEPHHAGSTGGRSLWWSWTAPSSGSVTLSTAGSGIDTVMGVYTGTAVDALTLVTQNDDNPNGSQAEVTFTATQNVTYQIAVDGFGGVSGAIHLILTRP